MGHYQFINESGAELFGHTPEEIIGKHDEDLFDPESAANIRADDVQVMESGEEMSEETVRFIDGEEHVFLDNKYPYRDEDGEIIGMIGISPDITERKQYVREIERRNERVDFASVVSHDLQNPLNVAQGQLQQAQKECESEHLDAIEHAHERMETLITDLRTLSQTGQAIGDLEAVTLEALSDECWQNVETTDSEMHTTTDGVIQADRSRLKQLLENLFRNAVEHGGENVTVTIGDLDSDRGFYVEDDGSGVPDGDRDQLFEPGYTTAQSTGLGLPIVKQIADAHGWAVTVSSGSAGGARFEFTGVVFTDEPHPSSGTADDTQDADAEESNE